MKPQFVLMIRTTAAGIEEGLCKLAETTDEPRLLRAVRMLDESVAGGYPIGGPTIAGMANLLRHLADQTGEDAFRRAERALRQQAPGRRRIDDRMLVAEVAVLVQSGEVPNLNKALQRVARTVAGKESVRAVAERLRRKFRALERKKLSTK